ncbi:hypothetical protein [Clostridiisalibacter paucivorans]|uniref:hypothetical protein n=1 Tax=Clostridiisalibacter paucivorans TaxID=408753 RepID=UPI00047E4F4C|nr:hypothetical protein [Clostridiisalibacter paucivorans]
MFRENLLKNLVSGCLGNSKFRKIFIPTEENQYLIKHNAKILERQGYIKLDKVEISKFLNGRTPVIAVEGTILSKAKEKFKNIAC